MLSKLTPIDAIKHNSETLIFLTREDSNVFEIDPVTGVVSSRELLSENDTIYNVFVCCDSEIAILPLQWRDNSLLFLDKDENMKSILLGIDDLYTSKSSLFFNGVYYKGKLFLFGHNFPGILVHDLQTLESSVVKGYLNQVSISYEKDGCFHMKYYRDNEVVYYPFMNANAVLEFHLDTEEYKVHTVGDYGQRFIAIEKIGEYFYLIPRDGRNGTIVKWDLTGNKYEQYDEYPIGFDHNQYAFYRSTVFNDKLILFAHAGNMNIIFDPSTGKMEKFKDLYDSSDVLAAKYAAMYKEEGTIYFLTPKGLIIWDMVRDEVQKVDYVFSEEIIDRIKRKELEKKYQVLSKNGIIQEDRYNTLESFIHYMTVK